MSVDWLPFQPFPPLRADGSRAPHDDLAHAPSLETRRRAVMAEAVGCENYRQRLCDYRLRGRLIAPGGGPCACLAAAAEEAWSMG